MVIDDPFDRLDHLTPAVPPRTDWGTDRDSQPCSALELLESLQRSDGFVRAAERPSHALGGEQVIDGDLARTPGADSLLQGNSLGRHCEL